MLRGDFMKTKQFTLAENPPSVCLSKLGISDSVTQFYFYFFKFPFLGNHTENKNNVTVFSVKGNMIKIIERPKADRNHKTPGS